jgi:hypothetical protein
MPDLAPLGTRPCLPSLKVPLLLIISALLIPAFAGNRATGAVGRQHPIAPGAVLPELPVQDHWSGNCVG